MKLFQKIVAAPKALNQWLNQNQNAPSHWRVLVYFGWSTLGLLAMWVASTPWPWLKTDLPDRTEETIAITATLGAFIVPLVLTVVQNAFRSAPAFSARLHLFVRYSRATELAQGFILLAGLGLFLSLAPPSPVTNLLIKWHFLLTAIAIGWTVWFIKEAMRFSNHYEQSAIIISQLQKKPSSTIQITASKSRTLIFEVIRELSLQLNTLAKQNPRGEYKDKVVDIMKLGDIALSENMAEELEPSFGPLYDLQASLITNESVPALALNWIYKPIFGHQWKTPRRENTAFVHVTATGFWKGLISLPTVSPTQKERQTELIIAFVDGWQTWARRLALAATPSWNAIENSFLEDLSATQKMFAVAIDASNVRAARWMADFLLRAADNLSPESHPSTSEEHDRFRLLQKVHFGTRITSLLIAISRSEKNKDSLTAAADLWLAQPIDEGSFSDSNIRRQIVVDHVISEIVELSRDDKYRNLLEAQLANATRRWHPMPMSLRVYDFSDGKKIADFDRELACLLILASTGSNGLISYAEEIGRVPESALTNLSTHLDRVSKCIDDIDEREVVSIAVTLRASQEDFNLRRECVAKILGNLRTECAAEMAARETI